MAVLTERAEAIAAQILTEMSLPQDARWHVALAVESRLNDDGSLANIHSIALNQLHADSVNTAAAFAEEVNKVVAGGDIAEAISRHLVQ